MEKVISNIIDIQNKEILKMISEKYNLDYKELLKTYNTPSFYKISKKNK
jgi:hypothetical protein